MHARIPSLLQPALLHSPNKHVEPILPEEWLALVYHSGNSPVSCRSQGAIILSKACFMSLWISNDCAFEFRKVKPCTRSRLCQMRTLIPAGNAAIPKEGRDLSIEFESLPPLVSGYP